MPNNRTDVYNGKLYYGAASTVYTTEGNVSVGFAGVWDGTAGTSGWTSLDGGITSGYGRGITVVNENHIYVFGKFSAIGVSSPLTHSQDFCLAKWNGSTWESVGTIGYTNNEVKDVIYDETNDILYAVGQFTQIYGVSANRVAKFQNGTWSGLKGGANGTLYSGCVDGDGNLYVCGGYGGMTNESFVNSTTGIAKWDGNNWSSIASGNNNSGWDLIYAQDQNCLYFAGSFSSVNGVANTKLLAKYDLGTQTWQSIANFGASDTQIYDIDYAGNGQIYFGGYTETHGDDVGYYDGTNWHGYGKNDGYILNPTQSSFGLIDLSVDNQGNLFVNRNASGFYILKNGETQWNRIDNLPSDVTIGQRGDYVEPPVEEIVIDEATGPYDEGPFVPTRDPTWFLSYQGHQHQNAKEAISGDRLLNLSDRSICEFIGETGATGPNQGSWTPTGETMNFSNHNNLTDALETAPTCIDSAIYGNLAYIHLFDASPKYTGYPTCFVMDSDGTTNPNAYDVNKIEQQIRKTLWRPNMHDKFTLFQPTTQQNYVLLVGPLENGHNDGETNISANYNF